MFIQKRQSENQNIFDTLAFQICSFSASSCYKIISADPFHLWFISFHPSIFRFIHSSILHFIHSSTLHSFHLQSTSFPSQIFNFDVFLQLNNTYHELQATSHTSLHFISCDPFHSIIHFIHIPLHHILLSIFIHSIQHSIHAPNHSISCFKSSTGTFYSQLEILQPVRHSATRQTFCSQRS